MREYPQNNLNISFLFFLFPSILEIGKVDNSFLKTDHFLKDPIPFQSLRSLLDRSVEKTSTVGTFWGAHCGSILPAREVLKTLMWQ